MAFSELWSHRRCEEEKDIIEKVNPTFKIVGNYLTGKKKVQFPIFVIWIITHSHLSIFNFHVPFFL